MTRTTGAVGTLTHPKQISFWHRRGSIGAATICRVHTAAGAQISLQSNAGLPSPSLYLPLSSAPD